MTALEAIILGIIQGISEFLPISSTGHLTLAGKFMGLIDPAHPHHWTAFIAVIQLGTMASVLLYFAKDIWEIAGAFLAENVKNRKPFKEQSLFSRLGWYILAGTLPIVGFGLGFKKIIEGTLTKNLYVISVSLIALAVLLALAEKLARHRKEMKDITLLDSFLIGCAQSVALIPGSSRSGTTITGALFRGLTRETAARFSFLLSIPAVLASGLLELREGLKFMSGDMLFNTLIATIVSGFSGYLAIDFLIKYLKKNSTAVFIVYRVVLGILILFLLNRGFIQP